MKQSLSVPTPFKAIAIVALAILLYSSCSPHYDNRLLAAEELMDSRPDSSLIILEALPVDQFRQETDKALFSLLLVQALDKYHISLSQDSIPETAIQTFENTGDRHRAMKALYYQGRCLSQNKDYTEALKKFFNARKFAQDLADPFWEGMSCRGISDIFNELHFPSEELRYAQLEYECIKRSGRQPYLNYALLDLARSQSNNNLSDNLLQSIANIRDSATQYNDRYLYHAAERLDFSRNMGLGKYEIAKRIAFANLNSEFASAADTNDFILACSKLGDFTGAMSMIEKMHSPDDIIRAKVAYDKFLSEGNYKEALSSITSGDSLIFGKYESFLNETLISATEENFDVSKKLYESRIKASRLSIAIMVLIALVAGFALAVWCRHFHIKQRMKAEENVFLVELLKEELSKKTSDNHKTQEITRNILASQYALLDKLMTLVSQYGNSDISSNKIADSVASLIESLDIDNGKLTELENQVDHLYGNLYHDFVIDFPGLKTLDYHLFLFSVLGFGAASITMLLKENKIESVYNRKRRLKNKIRSAGSIPRHDYMAFLS